MWLFLGGLMVGAILGTTAAYAALGRKAGAVHHALAKRHATIARISGRWHVSVTALDGHPAQRMVSHPLEKLFPFLFRITARSTHH